MDEIQKGQAEGEFKKQTLRLKLGRQTRPRRSPVEGQPDESRKTPSELEKVTDAL